MASKKGAAALTVQDTLQEGSPAAQANIILDLIEYIAEGKAVSAVVSDVCKVRPRLAVGLLCRALLRCYRQMQHAAS